MNKCKSIPKRHDSPLFHPANFPYEHWSRLRTNNGLERIMKEIRRRTRVVGSFPDGYSAMMLVGARLRHISTTKWGTRQYMNICKLYEGGIR